MIEPRYNLMINFIFIGRLYFVSAFSNAINCLQFGHYNAYPLNSRTQMETNPPKIALARDYVAYTADYNINIRAQLSLCGLM